VAAAVAVDDEGRVEWARIALGGVDATAIRVSAAESELVGAELTGDAPRAVAAAAAAACDPVDDPIADAVYRRELVAALVGEALVRIRAELAS
jgi:CO/xanthine dehydrogenase FAD-binding subunit